MPQEGGVAASLRVEKTPARDIYMPFRFGDIQLFVCEKIAEADRSQRTEPAQAKSPVRASVNGKHGSATSN